MSPRVQQLLFQSKLSTFTPKPTPFKVVQSIDTNDNGNVTDPYDNDINNPSPPKAASSSVPTEVKSLKRTHSDSHLDLAETSSKVRRRDPLYSENDVSLNDIGLYFKRSKDLNDTERYQLITNCWRPDKNFEFPWSKEANGKRKFNFDWLAKHPWLVYSKLLDGCFCLPCLLFGMRVRHNSGKFTKLFLEPLTLWTCVASKLSAHEFGK